MKSTVTFHVVILGPHRYIMAQVNGRSVFIKERRK